MRLFLLLTLLILVSCSNYRHMQNTVPEFALPAFDKEGHRGSRGLMPENTIPAMLHAIDAGVTTLEMDAVITADKKVILSHEPFFNHDITTKADGSFIAEKDERSYNIYKMHFVETQSFDVGMKPHPRFPKQLKMKAQKPLLSDVIDNVEKYAGSFGKKLFYNIETKSNSNTDNLYHPAPAEFVELIMSVVKAKGIQQRVIIQSFDFRTLQYLHQHYPAIKTTMLIEDYDKKTLEEQLKALGFIPTIYSPASVLVTDALIQKCHAQQIKVIPWTVNTKAEIEKLKAMGVDGIITDYPDLF